MQVGAHVWNGDKCGVVLATDENGGVTVGYFASVETLTSDSENPSPLSSSPVEEPAEGADTSTTDEPPAPAEKPAPEVVDESAGHVVEVDPLAALDADERATYTRLQGKLDSASSGA